MNIKNLSVALVTLIAASAAQAQQAVQWKVSEGGNGHWYQRVDAESEITWLTARDGSLQRNGYLVSINSQSEQDWIYNQLVLGKPFCFTAPWAVDRAIWIGLYQDPASPDYSEPAGGWRWVSNEPFSFAKWHPGEPNNGASENFAGMFYEYGGGWNDEPVDAGPYCYAAYVIEWSADCNNDGIVDYGQCRDGSLPDYNGNNIPDCCESGTPCVIGNYPVQWRVEDGGNGHWYRLVTGKQQVCWQEANSAAQALGGYLVSETSAMEHQFVYSRCVAKNEAWSGRWGPWIGAVRVNGLWSWTSGESMTFTSWYPGEPNGGSSEPVASYIAIGEGGGCGRTDKWNDWIDCGTTSPPCDLGVWHYVVEWSADCNNDGIVDFGQIRDGTFTDANGNGVPDCCDGGGSCTPCPGDVASDGMVDGVDLAAVLSQWGTQGSGTFNADIDGSGLVDGGDLGIVLGGWGPCPN